MLARLLVFLLLIASLPSSLPANAQTGTGGTVVVTVAVGGTPVEGAFVALIGSGTNRYGGVTGSSGTATFLAVSADTYVARASAPGTSVGSQGNIVVADGVFSAAAVIVTRSSTIFRGLATHGSDTTRIAGDGRTGVFYLNSNAIPSLYRTSDYGGTWAPVTISGDDPDEGIDGGQIAGLVTTSGYPGEIAAATRDKVWYSRDFGVTWSSIALPALSGPSGPNGAPPASLHWVHPRLAGATSRIFLVANQVTDTFYFDLANVLFPAWTSMAFPYKQNGGDKIAFANGESSAFAAVVPAAGGSVTLYRVGETPNARDPSSGMLANLAPIGAPDFVHLGGPLTGQVLDGAASPNTLLVYSNTATTPSAPPAPANGAAVMSTFSGGAWVATSVTQFRNEHDENIQPGPIGFNIDNGRSCGVANLGAGSIAPSGNFGSVGRCALQQAGATLIVRPVTNVHHDAGLVFDAEYGSSSGNLVILAGDAAGKGAIKSDRTLPALNRPDFPAWPALAAGGFSVPPYPTTLGGTSISGLNASVVQDLVISPTSVQNIALVMAEGGGSRLVGSTDGGANWFTLEARGGNALDWWQGSAGGHWLAMGSTSSGQDSRNLLSAVPLATPASFSTATVTTPVVGTDVADFGLTGRHTVRSIAGLRGTDKLVMAIVRNDGTAAALSVVTLDPNTGGLAAPPLNLGASFAAGTIPVALAHCPATGSATSVADKLFVAVAASTEAGSNGLLFAIAGPASSAPGTAVPLAGATSGNFRDVRVDCPSGTVYAGRYADASATGLVKATTNPNAPDALRAFAPVTSLPNLAGRERIETLDINPGSVSQVLAVASDGSVYSTSDDAATFTVLNDASTAGCPFGVATCGRRFGNVGDIEIGTEALLGVGGAYAAIVSLEPAAPTNLAATVSGFTVSMTWTASAGGGEASEYLVEAALDSAFTQVVFGPAPIGTATAASLTVPSHVVGTFYVRVRARNAHGIGAPSNIVAVTLPSPGSVPGTPGTPQVVVNADNTVVVTWAAPASGATPTGYRVYLDTPVGPFPGTPVTLSAITAVGSPFPLPASSYTLRVSAIARTIEGPLSAAAHFTIAGCAVPAPPAGFSISNLGGLNARLSWVAAAGATSYQVQVSLDASFEPVVLDANVGSTTALEASGVPGTFYVRIVGRNACGLGGASHVVSVTLP